MASDRVTIPATLCTPIPGTFLNPDGREHITHCRIGARVAAIGARVVAAGLEYDVADLSIPLDVPANLLGLLRAVWAKVTSEEAPLLLVLSGMSPWHWRLSGPRGPGRRPCVLFFGEGEPVSSRQHVIPALDGVTDPLKAAAIIAEAVLGGEA